MLFKTLWEKTTYVSDTNQTKLSKFLEKIIINLITEICDMVITAEVNVGINILAHSSGHKKK